MTGRPWRSPMHKVVRIVPRGDFQRAAAELAIDIFIGDDRDFASQDGYHDLAADDTSGSAGPPGGQPRPYRPGWSPGGWWPLAGTHLGASARMYLK